MKGHSVRSGLLYSLLVSVSAQSVSLTNNCYLTTTIIYGDPGTWISYTSMSSSTNSSSLQSTSTTTGTGGEESTTSPTITSTEGPTSTSTTSVISTPSISSSSVTDVPLTTSTISTSSASLIGPPLPTSDPFVVEISISNPTNLKLRKRDVSYLTFIEGVAYLTSFENQAAVFVLTATSYLLSDGTYVEPSYDQYSLTQGAPTGSEPVDPLSLPGPVSLQQTLVLAGNRYGWSFRDGALMLGNASFYIDDIGRLLVFFGGQAELPDNVVSAALGVEYVDTTVSTSSIVTDQETTSMSMPETFTTTTSSPTISTTNDATSVLETTRPSDEEEPSSSTPSFETTSTLPVLSSVLATDPVSTTGTTAQSGEGTDITQPSTTNVVTSSGTTSTSSRITSTSQAQSSSPTSIRSTQTVSSPPPSSSLTLVPLSSTQPVQSSTSSSSSMTSTRSTSSAIVGSSSAVPTSVTQSPSVSFVSTNSIVSVPTSSASSTLSTLSSSSRTSSTSAVVPTSATTSLSPSNPATSASATTLTSSSSTFQTPSSSVLPATTLTTTTALTTSTSTRTTSTSTTTTSSSSSSATATATPYPAKRGLAYSNVTTLTYYPPPSRYITWSYNYFSLPNSSDDNVGAYPSSQFSFIPLLFNDNPTLTSIWAANVNFSLLNYRTDALFGFNEPDACFGGLSSCMPLNLSLQGYKTHMQPFAGRRTLGGAGPPLKIGSVAVTNAADGLAYLSAFLGNATAMNLTIDFINLHWYASPYNIDYFKDYVTQAYTVVGGGRYPVWITEFGMDRSDYDAATVQQFMRNASRWCDQTSWVERYAWFGNYRSEGGATNLLLNADGSGLSPLGRVWRFYNGTG